MPQSVDQEDLVALRRDLTADVERRFAVLDSVGRNGDLGASGWSDTKGLERDRAGARPGMDRGTEVSGAGERAHSPAG